MLLKYSVVLLLCVKIILGLNCASFESCADCIGSIECVWCSADNHSTSVPRCQSRSYANDHKEWCAIDVYDPQSSLKTDEDKTLQLTPRSVKIKARPNQPVQFTMTYKPAVDKPLDLYFLVDNTGSMIMYNTEISKVANTLYTTLSNISNNVLMGVGSFQEKPAKPFDISSSSYSFKNDLKLTKNMTQFSEVVTKMEPHYNSDRQEAGLDALMQVMVCTEEIGWRNDSRKIIILSSDQGSHIAGDGKMVGAFIPNDMQCHLENDIHTTSLKYDYPSVGQINKVAYDNDFIIIFAIQSSESSVLKWYAQLTKGVHGAQLLHLEEVLGLSNRIKTEYEKSLSNVYFFNSRIPNIDLSLDPDCTSNKIQDECQIGVRKNKTINVTLTLRKCPKGGVFTNNFTIGPIGLKSEEKLKVEFEGFCSCECENEGKDNATECNGHGKYQCGICKCDDQRSGHKCECNKANENIIGRCKHEKCNDRGTCKCGICECLEGFAGDSCEVRDTSCKNYKGQPCGGNGVCHKSECTCYTDYINDDCSCYNVTTGCVAPESTEVCSDGKGDCICNSCKCHKDYTGKYCEVCDTCTQLTCDELNDYIKCLYSDIKNKCDERYNTLPREIDSAVMSKNETELDLLSYHITCKITLENDSSIVGVYGLNSDRKKWVLAVQDTLEVPVKANIWVTIGALVGSIILAGLIMLVIWKFTVDYFDNKEYEKFTRDAQAAGFSVTNPTYVDPVVKFINPTHKPTQ